MLYKRPLVCVEHLEQEKAIGTGIDRDDELNANNPGRMALCAQLASSQALRWLLAIGNQYYMKRAI